MRTALCAAALILLCAGASAATLTIRDGNGAPQTIPADTNGANITPHSVPEIGGADGFTAANPGQVLQSGSTGTDYSANAATVSGTPLITIPVTPSRAFVEVQNQSTSQCQVVRDDGAGNQQTSIILGASATAGGQGGGWSSATFKGRIRVYCPTGSQVAAYQD